MSINSTLDVVKSRVGGSPLGIGAVAVLCALTAAVAVAGARAQWKVVGIGWVAFFAMALAAPLGARAASDRRPAAVAWAYGLASGAMVTSAALFLLPQALASEPRLGGVGVAAGVLVGFSAHTVGHRLSHADFAADRTALELTAHALAAGAIIGIVYGAMPDLGVVLGLAIVSHKAPAGYAAARRLAAAGQPVSVLLVPAAGVGIAGLSTSLLAVPRSGPVEALVFGFATGVFLHVAMDFLPSCELGGDVYEVATATGEDHATLDRLRLHAVAATLSGGAAVVAAWLTVA